MIFGWKGPVWLRAIILLFFFSRIIRGCWLLMDILEMVGTNYYMQLFSIGFIQFIAVCFGHWSKSQFTPHTDGDRLWSQFILHLSYEDWVVSRVTTSCPHQYSQSFLLCICLLLSAQLYGAAFTLSNNKKFEKLWMEKFKACSQRWRILFRIWQDNFHDTIKLLVIHIYNGFGSSYQWSKMIQSNMIMNHI